jgi:hypothetical protein
MPDLVNKGLEPSLLDRGFKQVERFVEENGFADGRAKINTQDHRFL